MQYKISSLYQGSQLCTQIIEEPNEAAATCHYESLAVRQPSSPCYQEYSQWRMERVSVEEKLIFEGQTEASKIKNEERDAPEEKFVDLTSWNRLFYYISWCVITPSSKEGVADRASNMLIPITCAGDSKAIDEFDTFNKQEEHICKSMGKTFISGSLFKIEKGKIQEVKAN